MTLVSVNGNKIRFKTEGRYETRSLKEDGTFEVKGAKFQFDAKRNVIELFETEQKPYFDINERFKHLETFVDMTIDGFIPSVVICGEAGLGKSHTVLERFSLKKQIEDRDYVIVKGYSSPKGLFKTLYENRNKTIVFDDTDSILKDDVSLNLLKAALDSYSKRLVSWNSVKFVDDGLPTIFEFTGSIVFITNLSMKKLDGAVKSRALSVDVSMTLDEKITRMREVIKKIEPEIKLSTKSKVIDFIADNAKLTEELNFRTLIKGIKIFEATGDMRPVEYMLCNS